MNPKLHECDVGEFEEESGNDESTSSQLINYLQSDKGAALMNRLIDWFVDSKKETLEIQKQTLEHQKKANNQFQRIRAIVIILCIICVTALIMYNRFDSVSALFFGAIVAYLFGKEPK